LSTETLTVYVIYLTLVRLSIILTGTLCIFFGYMLFARRGGADSERFHPPGESDVEAKFAGAAFSLKNAAPGTSFALFGAIIIVAMFLSSPPGITIDSFENGRVKTTLRGDGTMGIQSLSDVAIENLSSGNPGEAVENTQKSLEILASPLNNLAWVLFKTDSKWPHKIKLAEIAVAVEPENHNFLHTLAEIQFQNGLPIKAIQSLEKANDINPSQAYQEQLNKWRRQTDRKQEIK
jgi:tetratricopeptide (TPR) repeat protein